MHSDTGVKISTMHHTLSTVFLKYLVIFYYSYTMSMIVSRLNTKYFRKTSYTMHHTLQTIKTIFLARS
jgi:hypothetical protein